MPHLNRHLRAAMLAAAGSVLVAGVVTGTATAQSSSRVPIPGSHPTWATKSAHMTALATGNVTANVYLAGQNQSGLAAYVTAVSTPGNALYRHYLSAAQVAARYGPTQAQISAVESG